MNPGISIQELANEMFARMVEQPDTVACVMAHAEELPPPPSVAELIAEQHASVVARTCGAVIE